MARSRSTLPRRGRGKATRRSLVALLVVVLVPVWAPGSVATAQVACDVSVVGPGDDVHAAVQAAPAGAIICLSGSFPMSSAIVPKSDQMFVGPAVLDGSAGADTGIEARSPGAATGATGVVIEGLEMRGFSLRAVACWRGMVVRDSWIHDNDRNGIGCGLEGVGPLLIENNVIEGNGDPQHLGSGSAGIKIAAGDAVTVRDNRVEANIGNGIWCDAGCASFTVTGNDVLGSTRRGVYFETSLGPAAIEQNTVQHNNCSPVYWGDGDPECPIANGAFGPLSVNSPGGGIAMNSSCPPGAACAIRGNTLGGNVTAGVNFRDDNRIYDAPFEVVVEGNVPNGDVLRRCGEWGIVCIDTSPPSAPAGLVATAVSSSRVDLEWQPSGDEIGVVGYDVWRDGVVMGSTSGTTFSDAAVEPEASYTYVVRARDGGDNVSEPSEALVVTTPAAPSGLFADGFESGDLSAWAVVSGVTVQTTQVSEGLYAARAVAASSRSFAISDLGVGLTDVTYEAQVRIDAHQGSKSVTILGLQTASGSPVVSLNRSGKGKLRYSNHVTGKNKGSTLPVPLGEWHEVRFRVVIAGASGRIEVWFDDAPVGALSRTDDTGTVAVGRLQIGDPNKRTFDATFDELVASSGA